jgi:hypothetical protein
VVDLLGEGTDLELEVPEVVGDARVVVAPDLDVARDGEGQGVARNLDRLAQEDGLVEDVVLAPPPAAAAEMRAAAEAPAAAAEVRAAAEAPAAATELRTAAYSR